MDKTAIGAATRGTEQEICKVRVQSTPEEISHFHELLDRCEELGLCNVINFSEMFANKGTSKYYRAYSDVIIRTEGENE
jgi:hypothetical protein